MKKVFLTIFAVAISLSSCKNYDDDFTALNKTIADLQAQVAGFSSLQSGLTSLQSSVASLQTTVSAIPTDQVDLSGLEDDLTNALTNIASLQADLSGIVGDYATSANLDATQAAVDALTTQLAAAQADLSQILASNNVYDGDLSITNAAELAFAVGLDDKVMIINGDLEIDNSDLDAAAVNAVTAKILNVTGNSYGVDLTAIGGTIDLSGLLAIGGDLTIYNDAAVNLSALASVVGAVDVTNDAADVDFTALTTVGGDYSVVGMDITDSALTTVGGNVALDYDGGYNQPNLTSAGIVTLSDYTTDAAATIPVVGTTTVDFSGLASATSFGTFGDGATEVVFASATSVKLNVGVTIVTANAATVVDLLGANYEGLLVSATNDDSVINIAGTVNDAATTTAGLALNVTGSATSVLNAVSVDQLTTLDTAGFDAIEFPALTEATNVTTSALTFTAADLVATSFTAANATDVSMASVPSIAFTAANVENLTFSALASDFSSTSDILETVSITGDDTVDVAFTGGNDALVSASFAGVLNAVNVSGATVLASLTTSGVINSFTLDAATVLDAVSFGHTYEVGGAGSTLVVTNNPELLALTTSTDYLLNLTVTGNDKLATMDFGSYTNVITSGSIAITITDNALTGDYDAAVAATATTDYVETVITSADFDTLKPFVAAFVAAKTTPATSTAGLTMLLNMSDVDTDPAVTTTLDSAMGTDGDHLPSYVATTGITTVAEFALIQ